jgi:hypothetical protein
LLHRYGQIETPVALVVSHAEQASSANETEPGTHELAATAGRIPKNQLRIDEASETPPPRSRLLRFQVGQHALCVDTGYGEDEVNIRQRCGQMLDPLDLQEPFGRIREAIEEAQRSAR